MQLLKLRGSILNSANLGVTMRRKEFFEVVNRRTY